MAATEAVATAQAEATLTLTAGELLRLREWVEYEWARCAPEPGTEMYAYWRAEEAVLAGLLKKLRAAEETARGGQTP